MAATVGRPARSALEPGRVGSGELMLRQCRRAAVLGVGQRDGVPGGAAAGEGVEHARRPTAWCRGSGAPARSAWATRRRGRPASLSSATAVSVEPISSLSQMVRSFLRRPPSRCSQSRWKMSARSPSLPWMVRHTRSSGRSSTSGADQRHTAGRAVAEDGQQLHRARRRRRWRRARWHGSPYSGKCSVRAVTGLNFLLVLRSGRWRNRRPSGGGQREVGLVDVLGDCWRPPRTAAGRGRRPGRTRGWSRSRARAGGPWG